MDNWFSDSFSESIWKAKYRNGAADIRSFFYNIAHSLSMGDKPMRAGLFRLLLEKRFCPGGRILAAAARPDARLSYMNCTTHAIRGDSLEDINETAMTIMRASSRGQGIGIDLSRLRPAGSPVNNAARTSTGAVSFMEMLNAIGGAIGQEGRRGAMLFSIEDTHPDLYRPDLANTVCPRCAGDGCQNCVDGRIPYDFIHVKRIPGKVENANISVKLSDAFLRAVEADEMWYLRFTGETGGQRFHVEKAFPAREIFMSLVRAAHASAEPGVLYWGTARWMSNSDLFGEEWEIVGCNACAEEILDQDGVCNLGSMNLGAYVLNPFQAGASFDFASFEKDIALAVECLDNVVTLEIQNGSHVNYQQYRSLVYLRRLGLGVMGAADALAMLRLPYGDDPRTKAFLHHLFYVLKTAAYWTSVRLAREKGPARAWDVTESSREEIMSGGFFATLPEDLRREILKYGTRNITLLSLAPTGTISNFFGASSGIEPLFAHQFSRLTRINGKDEMIEYTHPGVRLARSLGVPDSVYRTAYEVSPDEHILIQAIAQEHTDAAISKTINLPGTATVDDVARVYLTGWRLGLKGLSIYVDGSRNQQVLIEKEDGGCPACGCQVIRKEGCVECPACGWGKCML